MGGGKTLSKIRVCGGFVTSTDEPSPSPLAQCGCHLPRCEGIREGGSVCLCHCVCPSAPSVITNQVLGTGVEGLRMGSDSGCVMDGQGKIRE